MTFQEISEKLRARFGDRVAPPAEGAPEAVTVRSSAIQEVARFCKEDPELDFRVLSSLTRSGLERPDRTGLPFALLHEETPVGPEGAPGSGQARDPHPSKPSGKPQTGTRGNVLISWGWIFQGIRTCGESCFRRLGRTSFEEGLRRADGIPWDQPRAPQPLQQPEPPAAEKKIELKDLAQLTPAYQPSRGR